MQLDTIVQHDDSKPFPLPDECIDVVITSPPYWGLRDYGKEVRSIFGGDPKCKHVFTEQHSKLAHENRQNLDGGTIGNDKFRKDLHGFGNAKAGFCQKCGAWRGQLGLEPHPQDYVIHLVQICQEIKRVLKKSGSFYLNLGDTYYGSAQGYGASKKSKTGFQDVTKGFYAASKQKPPMLNKWPDKWLRPKQLLLIPSRVAIALQDDGWTLRSDIIWHKPNPMPSSVKDRLNTTYEHVFHFVKQKKYFYDLDAIREPHKTESVTRYQHSMEGCFTPGRAYPNEKREKPQKWKLSNGGKNPGDAFEYNVNENEPQGNTAIKQRMAYRRRVLGMDHDHCLDHPSGKNPGDVVTAKYKGQDVNPSEGHIRRGKELHDGFPPGYTGHPYGKNPGDVITENSKFSEGNAANLKDRRDFYRSRGLSEGYPLGKNPGDVICPESWGVDKNQEYHGDGKHNPKGQSPSDLKRNIVDSFKDNPKGRNPGDVFQTKKEPYVGNNPHRMRLKKQEYLALNDERPDDLSHPKGRNPGDVVEYNLSKECGLPITGPKARSNLPSQHQHRDGNPIDNNHKGKNPGDIYLSPKYNGTSGHSNRQGLNRPLDIVTIKAYKEYQEPIAKYLKQNIKKKHKSILDETFGKHKWRHWIRMDLSGAALPGVEDWFKLKEIIGFDDTFDDKIYEMQKSNVPVFQFGRNPGDVIKHDKAVGRTGNVSYTDPLHMKPYHEGGCNPGDIFDWKSHDLNEKGKPRVSTLWKSGDVPRTTHSLGRGPGDFWEICTQPFTGYNPELEHFAVFPESLVERPLKSSCPRWVCKKCGKPREKISERINLSGLNPSTDYTAGTDWIKHGTGKSTLHTDLDIVRKQIGWKECNCNAGFTGGVVLDPFCGRGTTGKVARELGLHYILFDIKPEYCELARLFVGGQKHKVPKGQSNLNAFL